jgi:hypothetical protein
MRHDGVMPADTDTDLRSAPRCTCGARDRDGAPLGCWHDDVEPEPERNPLLALAVYGPVGYSCDDEAF